MLSNAIAGLGLGLSLIIAIGAQNLFVLRQGIRREHVFVVAAICAVSDLVLIAAGVAGIGAIIAAAPWLVEAIRWAGAAFLVVYGLLAAKRAWRPSGETLAAATDAGAAPDAGLPPHPGSPLPASAPLRAVPRQFKWRGTDRSGAHAMEGGGSTGHAVATRPGIRSGMLAAALTCLALTWLNPHVYLDTVFMLGSIANSHGEGRWAFAAGAGAASLIWFFGLAYGARMLGRVLSSPRAWRILDACIALVMIALGVSLVLPH